jgi:hypothetical protein
MGWLTLACIRARAKNNRHQAAGGHEKLFCFDGPMASRPIASVLLELISDALVEPVQDVAFDRFERITTLRGDSHCYLLA